MSAIIPVNEQYCFRLTSKAWEVCEWKSRPDHPDMGEWQALKCFQSLEYAGRSLVQHLVSEQDLEGIEEVLRAIECSTLLIRDAIRASGLPDSHRAAHDA